MRPVDYFREHPDACQAAKDFCRMFKTMRDAWMSDDPVDGGMAHWMLWAIGKCKEPAVGVGVCEFAAYCAESAEKLRAVSAFGSGQRNLNFAIDQVVLDVAAAKSAIGPMSRATYAANAICGYMDVVYHATPGDEYAKAEAVRLLDLELRKKLRDIFPHQFEEAP